MGVATGVLGICAEALRTVFEGIYGIYWVLLPIWMGAVGWNLYRFGRSRRQVPVTAPEPSRLAADRKQKRVQ